jgi:hypothetical protein
MRGVHCADIPASTTGLSCPSTGPTKVADGPGILAKLAVIGNAEYLSTTSRLV